MRTSANTGRVEPEPYSYRTDPGVPAFPDDRPVIVFDGVCGFCSAWVQFVLRHDRDGKFRLLPAQSAIGHALYVHYGLDPDTYGTSILLDTGRARVKADGSLAVFERLGMPWSLAGALRLLPVRWLDWGYDMIARNRLRIMGRLDTCMIPEPRFKDRFLA